MKIVQITYEQLFNTGNYENQKISMTADLENGDEPKEVIDHMRLALAEEAENIKNG